MRPFSLSVYSGLLSIALVCVNVAGAARAQDAPDPPRPPMFTRLFPLPTGMNGYEEWVRACDLIQNNKRVEDMLDPDATLTLKRRMLAEPDVQAALHLLHAGMSKPVHSPRLTGDADDDDPLMSEYAVFRKMARLLYVELYVQFADGRIDAAIDTLDDGLRFGYRMQSNTLLSGLVGMSVRAVVTKGFGHYLDQLSEYQCLRVRHIVEEMMALPSPVTFLLRSEEQKLMRTLDAKRADPHDLGEMFNGFRHEEDWDENTRRIVMHLRSNPADLNVLVEQTKTRLSAYYDAVLNDLKLPPKMRKPITPIAGDTLDGLMFVRLAGNAEHAGRSYDRADAVLRLLGVHAAIRAYKWEYNHLPQSLAELHLRDLALDPFTGDPLHYQNNGATYDLFSRGSLSYDSDGKPGNAPPTPVRL